MASAWDNMNPDFEQRLRGLIAEAGGRITIVSGYRTPQRQQQLFAAAVQKYGSPQAARKWVGTPEGSNHVKGFAADLGGDLQLAHMLAPKYGLTFPMGHEAWHIEPEGLRSDPGAYTTPPDSTDAQGATQPQDHVDSVFDKLKSIFDGEANTSAVGEKPNASVGEFDGSALAGSGSPGESPMSGATQNANLGGLNDIDKFMRAIGGQESGGNYDARNADSGAAGKYQIMPSNWGPWASEAGLGRNAPMSADNQEKVARYKIEQYYRQFGDWGKVADAWYGGPGSVGKGEQASQGNYPTKSQYASQVLARMGSN